jgi:flagellar assembly protein FliH
MSKAVKFTFDTHFEPGAASDPRSDARSRKTYSAEEIERMKREAHEEGRRDGDVRASQAVAASIGQVASAVLAAIEAMDAEVEIIRAEAAALAIAAAKRLARAALASAPETEVVQALQAALHQAIGEPRVVVKTAPLLAQKIDQRASEIAHQEGYEGRIQFVADGGLCDADCRIEWRGGGIERAQAEIETALDDLIARRFPRLGVEETN